MHGIRAQLNIFSIDELKGAKEGDVDAAVNTSKSSVDDRRGGDGFEDDDDEFGTASALQVMKDKIVKDCMIVSCDLLCSVNVQQMANFYRVNNAAFVAVLADVIEQAVELPVPGSKGKFSPG